MHVVYVCGPYRAATEWQVAENIRMAERVASEFWKAGVAALCPHKNTAFMGGLVPDEVFIAGGEEMVRRCDTVFTLQGVSDSEGCRREIDAARKAELPIFTFGHNAPSEIISYLDRQKERARAEQ